MFNSSSYSLSPSATATEAETTGAPRGSDPLAEDHARNVDPREAERYASLAAAWWDTSGLFWPLHRLNALRNGYLRDALSAHFGRDASDLLPLAGLEILDVGCGGGILSESMAALGASVHGIDVVEKNVAIAREHARHVGSPVRYDAVDVSDLDGESYDVVLNMEVVEHVPDAPVFMTQCARLVRAGGVMTVATINRNPVSWLFAIVGAEYILRWLPRGTHQWRRFVKPSEAQAMLEAAGLEVIDRTGVRVNPITRSFSLNRFMSVNYMLIAARARAGGGR